MKYKPFESFIFRAPVFPVNLSLEQIFSSDIFQESIYLASPELFDAINFQPGLKFDDLITKHRQTIIKYILRAKSRCTPYGTFAGCGIGKIGDLTSIRLKQNKDFQVHTTLDTNLIAGLIDKALTEMQQEKLLFYSNDTIFLADENDYKYVEYSIENKEKKYFISKFQKDESTNDFIDQFNNGAYIKDLIKFFHGKYDNEDVISFIELLYQNKIIIPDLGNRITSFKEPEYFLKWLEDKLPEGNPIVRQLTSANKTIGEIRKSVLGSNINLLRSVKNGLDELSINSSHFFQTDLFLNADHAKIDAAVIQELFGACKVLIRINPKKENHLLSSFKKNFFNRYEHEEIPLLEAIDMDMGIGFGDFNNELTNISVLTSGFKVKNTSESNGYSKNDFLNNKYLEYLKFNLNEIEITDEDVALMDENWSNVSDTFYALIEVLKYNDSANFTLNIRAAGGSSAANLITRFGNLNTQVGDLIKEIINVENELVGTNQILAEVIHMPHNRLGNIVNGSENLRDFNISFLDAASGKKNNIPLKDLYLSMPDSKRIVLKSKILNKEVIPRLSTAHNFLYDTLPVYQLLSLLQTENKRINFSFNWGNISMSQTFTPRVRYKNTILDLAKWHIPVKEIANLFNSGYSLENVKLFKEKYQLPDLLYLVEGDQRLFLDMNDINVVELLLTKTKRSSITLEEYLFDHKNMLIKDKGGNVYTNEIIIGFKRTEISYEN